MAVNSYRELVLIADDVERDQAAIRQFSIKVFASPGGEQAAAVSRVVPADLLDLLGRLERRRLDVSGIIDLGEQLSELLLPDTGFDGARSLFARSLERLEPEQGLRVRLRLASGLASIPWEYLYICQGGGERDTTGFLALDPRISIVRHEALNRPGDFDNRAKSTPTTRRLLVALASPDGDAFPRLNLAEERASIERVLDGIPGLVPEFLEDATLKGLGDALLTGADIFHFAGHGTFGPIGLGAGIGAGDGEGAIILVGPDMRPMAVPADQLATNLRGRGVQLVILGACLTGRRDQEFVWSGVAAALVRVGIPAVVAMQGSVWDQGAIAFSESLYQALAAGLPLDGAVSAGRLALYNLCHPVADHPDREGFWRDWGTPVLYLRSPEDFVLPTIADPNQLRAARAGVQTAIVPPGSADGRGGPPEALRQALLREPVPTAADFVGRVEELASFRERLRRDRLVIIRGMAGVGKRMLGARLAREEAEREDQIFWFTFDRDANGTADSLLRALAAFLAIRGKSELWQCLEREIGLEQSLETAVKVNLLFQDLANESYILCLDNVEVARGIAGIAYVFELIRQRFGGGGRELPARFILMGRDVPSEMEYLVSETLEGFNRQDAATFVAKRGLQLPAYLMDQLWERTQGNVVVLGLSVSALAAMRGDAAAMERFIAAMAIRGDTAAFVMAHMYNVLPEDERAVIGALSIFRVPVERILAEEILAAEGVVEIAPCIDSLIAKDVVTEDPDGRIDCHDLVREYSYHILAWERKKRYHERAATYYEQQADYLRATYHHLERGAPEVALTVLTSHARTIINAGGAAALLERLAGFQQRQLRPDQWVALSRVRGDGHKMRAEYQEALAAYEAALEDASTDEESAQLLCEIGTIYVRLHKPREAIAYFEQSLELSDDAGDHGGAGGAHLHLGWSYYRLNELDRAREHFSISREIGTALGETLLLAKTTYGLGVLDLREGRLDEAKDQLEVSRRSLRRLGERDLEARVLGDLGRVYGRRGDGERQLALYQRTAKIQQEIGDIHALCFTYNNLGYLYHGSRAYDLAAEAYAELERLARATEHQSFLSLAHSGLAEANLARGNIEAALESALAARQVSQEIGSSLGLGTSCRVLGDVRLAQGNATQAIESFEESISVLKGAGEGAPDELQKALDGLEKARSGLVVQATSNGEGGHNG